MYIKTIALALLTLEEGRLVGPTGGREVLPRIKSCLPKAEADGAITLVQNFDREQVNDFFEMIEDYTKGRVMPEEISMLTGSILGEMFSGCSQPDPIYITAMEDVVKGKATIKASKLITALVKNHAKRLKVELTNFDTLSVLVSNMLLKRLA